MSVINGVRLLPKSANLNRNNKTTEIIKNGMDDIVDGKDSYVTQGAAIWPNSRKLTKPELKEIKAMMKKESHDRKNLDENERFPLFFNNGQIDLRDLPRKW